MDDKRVGVAAVLGAAAMWALEPIFAKYAFAGAGVLATAAVRATVVVPIAGAWLAVNGRWPRLGRSWPAMAYVALAAAVAADTIYLWALSLPGYPVVNAVLIGHMQPVFVIVMGWGIARDERLGRFDYLGIVIMVCCGLLVATRTLENLRHLRLGAAGDGLVLAATLLWATTTLVARKYLRHLPAGTVTFWRFAIAAVVLWALVLPSRGAVALNGYQVLVGVVVAVGTLLYYVGIRHLKAAQVSALELTAPFFAAVLAFVGRGETLAPMQMAGLVLLIGGIYCLARRDPRA